MAVLIDTSALVVLLRRSPPAEHVGVGVAAAAEIRSRRAVISTVTATELLVGARDRASERRLGELFEAIPAVVADRGVAEIAGRMGRDARRGGLAIPLPDLLIAASATYLGLPLLACDSDFGRGAQLAERCRPDDAWSGFRLHPASVVG